MATISDGLTTDVIKGLFSFCIVVQNFMIVMKGLAFVWLMIRMKRC